LNVAHLLHRNIIIFNTSMPMQLSHLCKSLNIPRQ